MRSSLPLLSILLFFILSSFYLLPDNDQIKDAKTLDNVIGYCSDDAAYTNIDATASKFAKASFWNSEGKDIWYKFTALRTDISISVTGKTTSTSPNTLIAPLIAIYTYDGTKLTEMIGSMVTANNLTTAYKGGLNVGDEYYIRISAENDNTGTFKLCVNNYTPPTKPGQDCSTASILCSKETFSEMNITGAGNNNRESEGTCLGVESNTAWYKWTASNDGTLTFSITPTSVTDDIDWVLYDLGPNGDCSKVTAANAIRCASGNGINCTPSYYITGLNLTSTDLSEQSGCPPGQDGWLKYVDMIQGHTYALLINNFSNGNNGFTLEFGGVGAFEGPKTEIDIIKNNLCEIDQSYSFSAAHDNTSTLEWNFGATANTATATGPGPHLITYNTTGQKNITLKASNPVGCSVFSYYNLQVANTPVKPIISASKTELCIGDILRLSTPDIQNAIYYWTGPNNFSSSVQNPEIKIKGSQNAGDYKLTVKVGECLSEQAIFNIPSIPKRTTAIFNTNLDFSIKYTIPISINFINQSINAKSYLWDFGDGNSSTETNPTHTYTTSGNFNISLTAMTDNECSNTTSKGQLVVLKDGIIFIPGAFSPNGDGINDEFRINIPNLKDYRFTIINRWGTKVFESTDIFHNWDGKRNNQDLPVGVYYYIINGKDIHNNIIKQSGSITLLR
ncbi:PKD domain-containing protein [Pedobacter hiemivivus]|uniref:PKD domain-containing protein n=1 Tax=Pedobacter hiemivivus TaxID=2530454 RepID=A0A4U1FZL0_9SPHI|nr:gliding motility-associated C-terminal domain-containing protein [Pedobacter hiemivivus]TKC56597.1 PKD domain-containing protein [Pedobacter hiemivivus]